MIEEIMRENLKSAVRVLARATRRSVSTISKQLYGNSTFLAGFFKGSHSVSLRKVDEMYDQLREEWPEDVEWPHQRAIVIPSPPLKPEKSSPTKTES